MSARLRDLRALEALRRLGRAAADTWRALLIAAADGRAAQRPRRGPRLHEALCFVRAPRRRCAARDRLRPCWPVSPHEPICSATATR